MLSVSLEIAPLVLSAAAILLSLVAIRRQTIPSRFEAQRRIRESLQHPNYPNKEMVVYTDRINYDITYVVVIPEKGIHYRIAELVWGDIIAKTRIGFLVNIDVPDSVETEGVSVQSDSSPQLKLVYDGTNPEDIFGEVRRLTSGELSEELLASQSSE